MVVKQTNFENLKLFKESPSEEFKIMSMSIDLGFGEAIMKVIL